MVGQLYYCSNNLKYYDYATILCSAGYSEAILDADRVNQLPCRGQIRSSAEILNA